MDRPQFLICFVLSSSLAHWFSIVVMEFNLVFNLLNDYCTCHFVYYWEVHSEHLEVYNEWVGHQKKINFAVEQKSKMFCGVRSAKDNRQLSLLCKTSGVCAPQQNKIISWGPNYEYKITVIHCDSRFSQNCSFVTSLKCVLS